MGWWTDFRDSVEAAAVPVANYILPGSALVTSQLVSEGAKQKLNTDFGNLAMLGSGIAGGLQGNVSNYNSLGDMFSGNTPVTGPELQTGTDLGGPGSSPANTGSMTTTPTLSGAPAATQEPVLSSTVPSGSNLPVDTTTGPINPSEPNSAYFEGQDAQDAAMGTVTPTTSPGFLNSIMNGNIGDAASAVGTKIMNNPIPSIYAAGSLYDMYAKKQMAKKQQDLLAQNRADILSTYAPGSPEYNLLKQEMERKDAAAGRNSQYGTRANELAGKIAAYKTNALAQLQGGQNTLANQSMANQYGMANTPLTLAALTATAK